MARNPIIYGLAKEIFVAEAKPSTNRQGKETKGGTWAGVVDGLKKGRTVYVRQTENSERNDNILLIQKGAVAVDFYGNNIVDKYEIQEGNALIVAESQEKYRSFPEQVKEILSKGHLSIKEIHKKLSLVISEQELKKRLEALDFVEVKRVKNRNYFALKGNNCTRDLFRQ